MPCSPTSCSASFTSSNLNGLITASIFFIAPCPVVNQVLHKNAAARPAERARRHEQHARFARPVPGINVSLARLPGLGFLMKLPEKQHPLPVGRGRRLLRNWAGFGVSYTWRGDAFRVRRPGTDQTWRFPANNGMFGRQTRGKAIDETL